MPPADPSTANPWDGPVILPGNVTLTLGPGTFVNFEALREAGATVEANGNIRLGPSPAEVPSEQVSQEMQRISEALNAASSTLVDQAARTLTFNLECRGGLRVEAFSRGAAYTINLEVTEDHAWARQPSALRNIIAQHLGPEAAYLLNLRTYDRVWVEDETHRGLWHRAEPWSHLEGPRRMLGNIMDHVNQYDPDVPKELGRTWFEFLDEEL